MTILLVSKRRGVLSHFHLIENEQKKNQKISLEEN